MTHFVPAQVVILDDEENILKALTRLFRAESYSVLTTVHPDEALKFIAENEVKVVLSDQRMPSLSGVDFLSRVRGIKPDAIRILFTGYADVQASQDAINKGEVYRYLSKPWNDDELRMTVREAVRRYDLILENRRLFETTQRQNEELETANRRIRALYDKEKEFTSTVSHELKTPLAAMKMSMELVVKKIGDKVPSDALRFIEINRKSADRLARLVDEILTLSKLESGDGVLPTAPVNLNEVIEEAALTQRIIAGEKGVALETELDPGLPSCACNADKIMQVVTNLIHNAVKFTAEGSVRVSTRFDASRGGTEIVVRDTGTGIAPEDMTKLFQRFKQLGRAEDRVSGTGLGLALCKAIMDRHHGSIEVTSESGRGSVFTVFLPVTQPEPKEKK